MTKDRELQTLQVFGMSIEDMRDDLGQQADFMGRNMLVISMLSDVQHLMSVNAPEQARQLVNRAKWVLMNVAENDLDQELNRRRQQATTEAAHAS